VLYGRTAAAALDAAYCSAGTAAALFFFPTPCSLCVADLFPCSHLVCPFLALPHLDRHAPHAHPNPSSLPLPVHRQSSISFSHRCLPECNVPRASLLEGAEEQAGHTVLAGLWRREVEPLAVGWQVLRNALVCSPGRAVHVPYLLQPTFLVCICCLFQPLPSRSGMLPHSAQQAGLLVHRACMAGRAGFN